MSNGNAVPGGVRHDHARGPAATSAPAQGRHAAHAGHDAAPVLVSILVPVLDEERHLEDAVRTMLAQDVPGRLEVLLVDGRSRDATPAIMARLRAQDDRVRLLENPGRTTALGLNVALRAARGTYAARMDAHAAYPAHYLRTGIERLERGDVAWVSGPQVPEGDGRFSRLVARALGSTAGRGSSDKWSQDGETGADAEWELTTSVFTGVWRTADLDALGGWDPAWPVNQDSELAARTRREGGRLVCRADMGARYVPRDTWSGLRRQYARYGRFRAKTFVRHPDSCGRARLAAAALPLALASAAIPGRPGRPGRLAAVLYGGAVAASVARMRPPVREAVPQAGVVATMHLAWGAGFLRGLAEHLPARGRLRASEPAPLDRANGDVPHGVQVPEGDSYRGSDALCGPFQTPETSHSTGWGMRASGNDGVSGAASDSTMVSRATGAAEGSRA